MFIFKFVRVGALSIMLGTTALTAGCVGTTSSQMQSSQDGRFTAHNILMTKGGVTHWVVLAVDNANGGQVVVNFGGETLTLGRTLVQNIIGSPGILPALISGAAGIRIANDSSCNSGCGGTIIYNDGSAYSAALSGSSSTANANANANAGTAGGTGGGHYSSSGHDPAIDNLTGEQQDEYYRVRKMLVLALASYN